MARRQVFGASKLRRKLQRMPEAINAQVRAAIDRGSREALFEMQKRAPVGEAGAQIAPSGLARKHLQDQLERRVAKNGLSARVGLLGKVSRRDFFFWRFLEFGTKKMAKRPFAFPAWRAVREKVRRDIRNATIRGFRTVARSK